MNRLLRSAREVRGRRAWSVAAGIALGVLASTAGEVAVRVVHLPGGTEEGRRAYLAQPIRFWGSGQYPEDTAFLGRIVRLSSGTTDYVFNCPGKVDSVTGKWLAQVGLCAPSKANWYSNGFLDVVINGKSARDFPAEIVRAEGGEKGTVTFAWEHPDARVIAEFALLPNDDKLLLEIKLEPRTELPHYEVRPICYPGSIRGGFKPDKMKRKREARTHTRVFERPEREDNGGHVSAVLGPDEPWVLFYDRHFDVAQCRGEGPCAVCYHPDEVETATVSIENYSCRAVLRYPGRVLSSHLVLWDLNGMSNHAGRRYMESLEVLH